MAGPQPSHTVSVSAPQQAILDALQRQASCPQALALRVRVILGAARGERNGPLAARLGGRRPTVRCWRARWVAAEAQRAAAEADPATLRQTISQVLADAPRSGAPRTFTAEQVVHSVNLAGPAPRSVGRPIDAWSVRELADEAIRQGIVTSISPATVGRFLGRGGSAAASEPLLAERQDQGD